MANARSPSTLDWMDQQQSSQGGWPHSTSPTSAPSCSSPLAPRTPVSVSSQSANRPKAVTPGSFVSPRDSKEFPIPSSTAETLEQRRLAFFRPKARPSPSTSQRTLTPSGRGQGQGQLQPGPRPANFKRPPSALLHESPGRPSTESGDNVSALLYRQRFRQRCQAALARETKRRKGITRARGRDVYGSSDVSDDNDDDAMPLHSDDLSSSDIEEDAQAWQYEDEELVRRVMLAEYRNLLRAQEHSGRRELGWLGADEVAWLEEELQREGEDGNGLEGASSDEPPSDIIDEDEALFEQYQHHQSSTGDLDVDGEYDDETLAQIDIDEAALTRSRASGAESTAMDTS